MKVDRLLWLYVFLVSAMLQQAVAQTPSQCVWVSVNVGPNPENIGWTIVSDVAGSLEQIPGAGRFTGGYSKTAAARANGKFCHEVVLTEPYLTSAKSLRVFSADGTPWLDRSSVVAFTDPGCQHVQKAGGLPVEAFKTKKGPFQDIKLPPLDLYDCSDATISGLRANAVSNVNGGVACPNKPVLDPKLGLGPDLIALASGKFQKIQVVHNCWDPTKKVKFNPDDWWNPKFQAYCEALEVGIPKGCYLTLRFRAGMGNIGTTDLWLGDPYQQFKEGSPLWTWGDCHKHWHWRGFARYELEDVLTKKIYQPKKVGYCAEDTMDMPKNIKMGVYNGRKAKDFRGKKDRFNECGTNNKTACQGVSPGKMDVYDEDLAGQFFCLTGCKPGDAVAFGREYILRVISNPPYKKTPGVLCPNLDSKGLCHSLFELNYDNNVDEMRFNLTLSMVPKKYRSLVNPTSG